MKDWKKCKEELMYIDICSRDAPCMCVDGVVIIGTYDDSHATLISKLIYGMDISNDYKDKDMIESIESEGGKYFRSDIDEENVAYGHKLGTNIYWDITEDKTRAEIKHILSNSKGLKGYTHYSVDPFNGLSTKLF